MTKTLCLAAVLALSGSLLTAQTPSPTPAPAAPVVQAAHPDFSGTWTLNLAKSDFDQIPPPASEVLTFTQTGSNFTVAVASDSDRGKENYTLAFPSNGTETPIPSNVFPATAELRILSSKGEWQGSSLILTEKITYQGNPGTLKSTYTLSADGKTLTRAMHITVDQGEFDTTSVFDRQTASGDKQATGGAASKPV